ncbi:MAG: hypothetical protein AB7O45_02705 [Alphaproteobacteria bacterium]
MPLDVVPATDEMTLVMDPEVKEILTYMQRSLPAARLVPVATAIAAVAPILWGHFDAEVARTLWLELPPLMPGDDPHRR